MRKSAGFLFVVLLLLGACAQNPSNNGRDSDGQSRTMQQLADSTQQVYKLETPANPELVAGPNRFVFGLFDNKNAFATNKDLELFFGSGSNEPARGPVKVGYAEGVGDLPFYRASIDFPSAGTWLILVVEKSGPRQGAGVQIEVKESSGVPKVGDAAISTPTPTVDDHLGVEDVCTRDPEDPMHGIALDQALANGKPTVVVFATPALCTSRICGPVVDQVLRVRDKHQEEANFIHVEVFKDKAGKAFAPGFAAWKLVTEPWTFVIDSEGIIQARFEGPVTPEEIEEELAKIS
jgi:hypothetical protein